uniref:Uncharacterized protein n=1 Tax=Arundo donax TaxID=35708 RepID=A0A0A9ERH3_ARUDO
MFHECLISPVQETINKECYENKTSNSANSAQNKFDDDEHSDRLNMKHV